VQTPTRLLVLFLLFTAVLSAHTSLENARRAQLTLGEDIWSQIIRVENATRGGHYARTVYALVFELQGLLWFYSDADGTQSFSLHYDDLAAEKADFAPLLRDIEPGFVRWHVLSNDEVARIMPSRQLRNGCFIESFALWRERARRGEPVSEPQLLSYYFESGTRRNGHTVLAFREGDVVKLVDPMRPTAVVSVPLKFSADPLTLARELGGRSVGKARFFPLENRKLPPVPGVAVG
jgi:hypothetical protein